jgi:hypothetical protein
MHKANESAAQAERALLSIRTAAVDQHEQGAGVCRAHMRFAGAHQPASVVVQVPLGARHSRGADGRGRRPGLWALRLRWTPLLQVRDWQIASSWQCCRHTRPVQL